MSTEVLKPRTLWAQNKKEVFLTFEIFEGKDIEVTFEKNRVGFSGIESESNQKFEVELELFDEIVPDNCTKQITPRFVLCHLEKANAEAEFWPRLISDKSRPHFIHVDFARWQDEEEEEDPLAQPPFDPSAFMNFAGGPGAQPFMGDEEAFEDSKLDSSDEEDMKDLPKLEE